jgi:hypothetical protein
VNTNLSTHVAALIHALEASYGARFQSPKPHHLPHWEAAFARYAPRVLAEAVERVRRWHTHGAPGIAELQQTIEGRWSTELLPATDCHGVVNEHSHRMPFQLLKDPMTGAVMRAFDGALNLIHWPSQNQIASAKRMLRDHPTLLPPGGIERLQQEQQRQLGGGLAGGAIDFNRG